MKRTRGNNFFGEEWENKTQNKRLKETKEEEEETKEEIFAFVQKFQNLDLGILSYEEIEEPEKFKEKLSRSTQRFHISCNSRLEFYLECELCQCRLAYQKPLLRPKRWIIINVDVSLEVKRIEDRGIVVSTETPCSDRCTGLLRLVNQRTKSLEYPLYVYDHEETRQRFLYCTICHFYYEMKNGNCLISCNCHKFGLMQSMLEEEHLSKEARVKRRRINKMKEFY
jgi:hypothetical protein